MASYHRSSTIPSTLAACLLGALTVTASAQAAVISSTPTLPLLNTPYETTASIGCFPLAGVCITGGSLTLTSVDLSNFNTPGQDIITEAAYTGTLTTLGNILLGPVTLTGTVEQEVIGRTTSAATGSWTVDLLNLSLSGPVQGNELTLTLTNGQSSDGTTSIVPLGAQGFSIDSFFDVFFTLSLDSPTPLQTTSGPIQFVADPIPEPAIIGLLGLPLILLFALRKPNQADSGR
jgi:hypothetical protein